MAVFTLLCFLTMASTIRGNGCKDYKLTASDQSLVDMVKHYLHTSRQQDFNGNKNDFGVTFIRWGKKSCPERAELVYTGQMGGSQHNHKGGGSNYLCLPNNPDKGHSYSKDFAILWGGEYQTHGSPAPNFPAGLDDQEVPCSLCRRKGKSSAIMIPAKTTCSAGWKFEYKGFLMTEATGHNNKDFVCVDSNAEAYGRRKTGDKNGALLYAINTKCGSLRCPPYENNKVVMCVVCTK